MRVLHTSDWHLGARLKQVERLSDQLRRVEEVLTICDKREVDLLLVAGDVVDETSPTKMPALIERLGDLLRPRLERGLVAVFLAGNHDRPWIFPFLQGAGDLFSGSAESARLHFSSKPELRIVKARGGERLRLMLLPYPWAWNYSLEAVPGATAADRRREMARAVQGTADGLAAEAASGEKIPTVLVGHLLVTGVESKRHELTESEDVPVPRTAIPNYPYAALGHIHQAMALGNQSRRYSGSIERMDFGEMEEEKSVVLVEVGKGDLLPEPEVVPLHPTELFELNWHPGDSIEEKAATVPEGAITKLRIHMERGMSPQAIQSQAKWLIGPRLLFPPDIVPLGGTTGGHEAGPALDRLDWQENVRLWVGERVAEADPLRTQVLNAVEELIAEEAQA